MSGLNAFKRPTHLGLDATAVAQPEFTGDAQWYEAYGQRHATAGKEGRLVTVPWIISFPGKSPSVARRSVL
jgi:hypothetical protein